MKRYQVYLNQNSVSVLDDFGKVVTQKAMDLLNKSIEKEELKVLDIYS